MDVEEMIAMFLHIVSHDIKNRIMRRQFARSGETVSRQFNAVLNAVLRLHELLLKKPEPILGSSTDERWKWFKNCLEALDGSAADSRVLRDAISRTNGLKVPQGHYYLCDAGYPNGEGFLAPYRGQRYHLNDWDIPPNTPTEFFNMKHSSAGNIVERAFGLLKGRWEILRGRSYYPVKIQCRIILACCLLHNLIRREMPIDPLEQAIGESEEDNCDEDESVGNDHYTHIEISNAWTSWRDNLAREMFNQWSNMRKMDALEQSTSIPGKKHQWTSIEDSKLVECLLELSHPNAKGLRNRPFPHYEDLVTVDNDANSEFDHLSPIDDLIGNATNSHTNTATTSAQSSKKSRKRFRNEDPLVEVLTDIVKKFGDIQAVAGDSIRRIADCFQFETEGATRRMKVFDELKQIDGLTNEQRVKAGKLLVQNQAYIDFLFTLDDEFKLGFILGLFE
ncbi:uncharacterized protein LOC133814884 [Humulus lupulus]|uniref:uncharacterized protein LOC133814884 n=1 Tax=Humulus lupulus TaxID=3486 RepID=UPI002B40A08E|nr:uncharacterized protein LOC133814884 [Humulus lupulus]